MADEEKESKDVLQPLARPVSQAHSTTEEDAANSNSMMYSEDESLSDAYFLPQKTTWNEEECNLDKEDARRSSLWETDFHEAISNEIATEETTLLRRQQKSTSHFIARDVVWSIVFLLHILLLMVCAVRLGRGLLLHPAKKSIIKTTNAIANAGPLIVIHENPTVNTVFTLGQRAMEVTVLSTGFAVAASSLFFAFLMLLDKAMIYIMLGLANLFGLACVILGLSLQPYGVAAILGFAFFVGTLSYTVHTWNQIGFASVLLHTAVSSLRPDMAVVGGVAMLVMCVVLLLWEWASIGIVDSLSMLQCTKSDSISCTVYIQSWEVPIILLMLCSLIWTARVVVNTVRVIVAGLTATWWFAPHYVPIGTCGTDIAARSVRRALSASFGSICLGSLVVGVTTERTNSLLSCCCCQPITTKHGMMLPASRSDSMIIALANDIETVGVRHGVNRLCHRVRWYCSSWNKYAFCFVGMYGFNLTESGSRVNKLFRGRRWQRLSNDSLLSYTLFWAIVAVDVCTGLFAVLMNQTDGDSLLPLTLCLIIGIVVGSVISGILFFGVVGSAVNTALTCFAVSATDLDKNHPNLGRGMMEAWGRYISE